MYRANRNIDIDTFEGVTDLIADIRNLSPIKKDVVEEVTAGKEFDETASVIIPGKTNHQYKQKSRFKGITHFFKMYNDIYMHITTRSIVNKSNAATRINLTFLNPEPIRQKFFAWNWLYAAMVACLLGVQLIYFGEFSDFDMAHPYMLPIGTVLVVAGLLLTQVFYYRTQDKMIYKSLVGQVPLIEVFYRPEQSVYRVFTGVLKLHIVQAQQRSGLNMKHRLRGELSDLRRLSEEGVITNEDYEQARALIFKHKEYQHTR